MTRRVLHPSDFSSASDAAFKKAIDMAKASQAELLVAHVISPIVPVSGEDARARVGVRAPHHEHRTRA